MTRKPCLTNTGAGEGTVLKPPFYGEGDSKGSLFRDLLELSSICSKARYKKTVGSDNVAAWVDRNAYTPAKSCLYLDHDCTAESYLQCTGEPDCKQAFRRVMAIA